MMRGLTPIHLGRATLQGSAMLLVWLIALCCGLSIDGPPASTPLSKHRSHPVSNQEDGQNGQNPQNKSDYLPIGQAHAKPGLLLKPTKRSKAVYPEQEIPFHFSHQKHLKRGMTCEQCHQGILKSDRSSQNHFPRAQLCDSCHGKQHPLPKGEKPRCQTCHEVDAKGRVQRSRHTPPPRLVFSHKKHRDTPCQNCHGDLSRIDKSTREQLPSEAMCRQCHDGKKQSDDCRLCHPKTPSGRLDILGRSDRSLTPLVPHSRIRPDLVHDISFVRNHGQVARAQRSRCESCHSESFCGDCHQSAERPLRLHPGGFLGQHGQAAISATASCLSCHQAATDCRACHLRLGVSDRLSLGQRKKSEPSSLSFHPPGFASLRPGPGQGHGAAVRKNPVSCMSCHSEDTCLSCHATTKGPRPGYDISPHAATFVASGRCRVLAQNNRRVCLKCHAPGSLALDCVGSGKRAGM